MAIKCNKKSNKDKKKRKKKPTTTQNKHDQKTGMNSGTRDR